MTRPAEREDEHEIRILGEWDWWMLPTWSRLHAATEFEYVAWAVGNGTTACGRHGVLTIPGIFTRMDAWRCRQCCRALSYPPGQGSPKNDDACRPLVEQRLRRFTHEA